MFASSFVFSHPGGIGSSSSIICGKVTKKGVEEGLIAGDLLDRPVGIVSIMCPSSLCYLTLENPFVTRRSPGIWQHNIQRD